VAGGSGTGCDPGSRLGLYSCGNAHTYANSQAVYAYEPCPNAHGDAHQATRGLTHRHTHRCGGDSYSYFNPHAYAGAQ